MDIRKLLGMVLLGASVALAGCGGSGNGETDSGPTDGGGDDGGGGGDIMFPDGMPMVTVGGEVADDDATAQMGGAAPNLDCMGSRTAPSEDGSATSFDLQVEEFINGTNPADLCVNFYADNVLPMTDTCGGMMTDDSGIVSVSDVPGSWYSYRIFPKDGATDSSTIVGSFQINETAPDGGQETATAVSVSSLNLIPAVLGFQRAEGAALVAGRAEDCDGEFVHGVILRIYLSDGTLVPEGEGNFDPHYRYFDGAEGPSSTQPWTHIDGLYAAANIPASMEGESFIVEMWGKTTADGAPEVIGCEQARLLPDGFALVNVGPQRADGPDCPGAM